MNNYAIEYTNGRIEPIKADFIEIKSGFFLFFRDDISEVSDVVRYEACQNIVRVTLQKEYTEKEVLEQLNDS